MDLIFNSISVTESGHQSPSFRPGLDFFFAGLDARREKEKVKVKDVFEPVLW